MSGWPRLAGDPSEAPLPKVGGAGNYSDSGDEVT